ncbi:glycosyltransferase [Candidatus Poriferisodalis sp.]|uniref:glycosyltransferase n=1 Tax=Candidatus Poriferisodalis sp. TaxID=3101277 RepID=UPI003B0224B3
MAALTTRPPCAGSVLRAWVEAAVVVASCVAVVAWLDPGGIVSASTPTGGDMGAHVWGPAFLREELLPAGSLRGWSPEWYAGMPAMQFYMVLPYLMIVAADLVLPYGVAFKLVAISGVVSMPAAAWLMGRLAGWAQPLRMLLPVALLLFVFDVNFTIYGGNAASTLAGEFAFSIALSATLVYLGMLWRSLERGTGRARASLVLAFVALCHPIPLAFAVAASILMVAVRGLHALPDRIGPLRSLGAAIAAIMLWAAVWNLAESPLARLAVPAGAVAALVVSEWRRSWHALVIGIIGGALSAFWTVPFLARRAYLNDMGWERLTEVREHLFFTDEIGGDGAHHSITWLLVLAGVGAVVGLARWYRPALMWAFIAFTMAMGFVHWPQHRLWNARILPFWYLAVYVLAAMGLWLIVDALTRRSPPAAGSPEADAPAAGVPASGGRAPVAHGDRALPWVRVFVPVAALAAVAGLLSLQLGNAPGARLDADGAYRWGPFTVSAEDRNFVSGWARWNFRGYEGRPAYREYHEFVTAMSDIGETPAYGCGRLLWEYDRDIVGAYGTPMAPMLLPHWTDDCIASMEGLYFESSPTVPFHFLMQSELSASPSRPMRGLPYSALNFDLGVAHLQMSGVRYYAAFSTEATAAAQDSADLQHIASAGPWSIYLVADSDLVSPLPFEPAVAEDVSHAGRAWTDPAAIWWNDPAAWAVPIAADGPEHWSRVSLLAPPNPDGAPPASLTRFSAAPRHALPPVQISNVEMGRDWLSFSVDRPGVPVLVKVSYFPNWSVRGAEGPYRVTPNWMVVIPTDERVELTYGATAVEYLAWLATLLGAAALALVAVRPPVRFDRSRSARSSERPPAGTERAGALRSYDVEARRAAGEHDDPWLPAVSVVLPAYQAAHLVGAAVTEISAALGGHEALDGPLEIVVVDDGSTDGTAEEARRAGADVVVPLEANRGKGAAVRAGMLAASGRLRLFTDVDLAYPPGQLTSLIDALRDGADVALGNRRHAEARTISPARPARAFASRTFNAFTRLVLLRRYRDTQCGFKGFTADAAQEIFSRAVIDGFAFDVEVLYLVEHLELTATEVPVSVDHSADTTVRLVAQSLQVVADIGRIRHRAAAGAYDSASPAQAWAS